MTALTKVLSKLGVIEIHGIIFAMGLAFFLLFQFSIFESFIATAALFAVALPSPKKDEFLAKVRFGNFKAR